MSDAPMPPPPPPGTEETEAVEDKPWWKQWWAITGLVVLALLTIFLLTRGGDDEPTEAASPSASPTAPTASPSDDATTEAPVATTEAVEPSDEPAPTDAPTPSATPAATPTPTPEPTATPEPTEAGGEPGSRENPLEVGDMGTLPEWDVTVDEIDLDATQAMLDASDFNDDPENGNYGLVTLTATYTGDEEGDAGFLLGVTLVGADSRQYSDSDCLAIEPDSLLEQPTVENGGTVTGQLCLDFPDEARGEGAILFIEEVLSFDGDRVFWAIPTQ